MQEDYQFSDKTPQQTLRVPLLFKVFNQPIEIANIKDSYLCHIRHFRIGHMQELGQIDGNQIVQF